MKGFVCGCVFVCVLFGAHTRLVAIKDQEPGQYSKDMARILGKGKITVAILNAEHVPFFFHNKDGVLSGLDVELSGLIAEKLGVRLEFNRDANTFNELTDVILERKADVVISKFSKTLERSKKVLYTRPYLTLHHALMFNRLAIAKRAHDNPSLIQYIQEFDGKIGIIRGSSYVNFAKNFFPKATVQLFPDWDGVVKSLFRGDIVVAYRDELEVKKVAMQYPDASLKVKTVLLTDTSDTIAMAVHYEDSQLLFWLNSFLESGGHDYSVQFLFKKYEKYLQK